MEDERRRRVDELIARYELEPSLRDIYVEGITDKSIIDWFLKDRKVENYAIYEIDTVELPAPELFDLGLIDNARSRVIALAWQIDRAFNGNIASILCIADRDFDDLLGISNHHSNSLIFTDYTSIEMYLFNLKIIDKFVRLAVRSPNLNATEIIKQISPVLEALFLIRAANHSLGYGMEWLAEKSWKRCLVRRGVRVEFKFDDFLNNYLNKNNRHSNKEDFSNKINELRHNTIEDIKKKIRGHDFIEILCWYLEPSLPKNRKGLSEPELAFGTLLCCLDAGDLLQEGLFQRLVQYLK